MNNEKYNEKRKRILEELDKGTKVPIMELGMYDLTPYFRTDEFDGISLSDYNKVLELIDFQYA